MTLDRLVKFVVGLPQQQKSTLAGFQAPSTEQHRSSVWALLKSHTIVRYHMRFFRLLTWVGLWTFTSFFGLYAQTVEPLRPDDRAAVRLVIEGQLAAFAADDAEQAFSYASETIQATFMTARNFMDMVRIAYPVVYRPASLSFQVPVTKNAEVWQAVQMRDAMGVDWMALYTLKRQADGVWKINGCVLQRGTDRAA
jgi:hypothetical protein